MTDARTVLTTTGSVDEARQIARTLVDEGLAACATMVPSVESIYRWQGKVEEATETLLVIKTEATHIERLRERLETLHSYQTPELLVFAVEGGSGAYLRWLHDSLSP